MPKTCLKDLSHVPKSPGVYLFFDKEGALAYVGKAKNLRRRLSQYRNTKRMRKHERMRRIVRDLKKFTFEVCATELEALIRENELIQKQKPKWNLSGAFYFMYPCLATKRDGTDFWIAYATDPDKLPPGYTLYGSFRSRYVTRYAYFALCRLFNYIGHSQKKPHTLERRPLFRERQFRQISGDWPDLLESFFDGKSNLLLEKIVHALLEKPKARRRSDEVQGHLDMLIRFYQAEARRLRFIKEKLKLRRKFISQNERDRLYLLAKASSADRADFHANQAAQRLA